MFGRCEDKININVVLFVCYFVLIPPAQLNSVCNAPLCENRFHTQGYNPLHSASEFVSNGHTCVVVHVIIVRVREQDDV